MSPGYVRRSLTGPPRRLASSSLGRWCLAVGVVAALVVLFIRFADPARAGRSFLHADWHWACLAVLLMLVSLALRSLALKVIVDALGSTRARVGDVFSATSIGLLANAVIPIRAGTVLAPYALYLLLRRRGARIPFATVLGVTLTERLFTIATFVALSLLSVSALDLPAWAIQVLLASAVFAATFLIGGLVLERRRQRAAAAAERPTNDSLTDGSRVSGFRRYLPELVDSQRIMGKPWSVLLLVAVQTLAWLVQLVAAWAALQAFHLGGAGLQGAALVLILTNLIGLVPITPGNVGTFQAAAVAALAAGGLAAGPAVAYALGLQAMQLVVAIAAGSVSLSLHDLRLADLSTKSRHAGALLQRVESTAAVATEEPTRL